MFNELLCSHFHGYLLLNSWFRNILSPLRINIKRLRTYFHLRFWENSFIQFFYTICHYLHNCNCVLPSVQICTFWLLNWEHDQYSEWTASGTLYRALKFCIVIDPNTKKKIILYFQLDTLLFCLRTISAIFFPLHVSGLTGPSSGCLYCTCSLWYSPPLQMSLSCDRWETTARQRHLQRGRIP